MLEKELYPYIEDFLKKEKNCSSEYLGNELFLKRGEQSLRADVFGISKSINDVYLCEGKRELKDRNFGKVIGESVELLKYADYVYVFGTIESFENKDVNDQIDKCKKLGIGILTISINDTKNEVKELLVPQRNSIKKGDKKEIFYRIFVKNIKKPIAEIIFQGAFEYIKMHNDMNCVRYIDVYNSLFSDEKYKNILRTIIGDHSLLDRDMRKEFQTVYGKSDYISIRRMNTILEDLICFTEDGLNKARYPILLD